MKRILAVLTIIILIPLFSFGEDGYSLWLRYLPLPENTASQYRQSISSVLASDQSPVVNAALTELEMAMHGMLGKQPARVKKPIGGTLLIGKQLNRIYGRHISENEIEQCGNEGFIIRSVRLKTGYATIITGKTDKGILYGTFTLIRQMQTGQDISNLNIIEKPKYNLRLLNHWDNINGTVERGYAGRSIWWNRDENPEILKKQYTDYARANASASINGAVLNNVNASPEVLKTEYIAKFAAIADVLRPYNIKVYMSVNFSSPAIIGGLPDSDPMKQAGADWWKNKVKEIYAAIPDFGGFLVKANSEGQPGPQKYGRTHADGANMLAAALNPYGGVVFWRSFVYEPTPEDRAKQAYNEFLPLDGKFAENVIVQVKNGPVDFQPREPFSPLFGAMQKTPLMVEFQITQEYLGFSNHLVYLAPFQKEVLESDTWCKGKGSTVAKVTDGTLFEQKYSAIAGVANIGRDTNWCGHHFAQANWYAFGRLAWNHELPAQKIAAEWLKMTFSADTGFTETALDMMMRSREAAVNYMTPLGLHHLMGWDHHHGPEPWTEIRNARPDWLPKYYHNANIEGIGFNRSAAGSNAVAQYFSPLREMYGDPKTCPNNMLLWFHHLPWDYELQSGNTLWEELCYKYYGGVEEVKIFQKKWDSIGKFIDRQRFDEVQYKLKIQCREAIWWRDACLLYFQTYSGIEIPLELERPIHDLVELKKMKFDLKNHN